MVMLEAVLLRTCCVVLLLCRLAGSAAAQEPEPRPSGRGGWALLLTGYLALTAATVGGAHLFRDNFVGRSVAITAGGWGGLTVGAGAGWGLARLTCRPSPAAELSCQETA